MHWLIRHLDRSVEVRLYGVLPESIMKRSLIAGSRKTCDYLIILDETLVTEDTCSVFAGRRCCDYEHCKAGKLPLHETKDGDSGCNEDGSERAGQDRSQTLLCSELLPAYRELWDLRAADKAIKEHFSPKNI